METNIKLTRKTKNAINKHGMKRCLEAFKRYEGTGTGATTIAYDMDVTTNQADAMIDAGRELTDAALKYK